MVLQQQEFCSQNLLNQLFWAFLHFPDPLVHVFLSLKAARKSGIAVPGFIIVTMIIIFHNFSDLFFTVLLLSGS